MRLSSSAPILAAALVLLPAALAAQTAGSANASRPPGCRGTTSQTSSVGGTGLDGKPVEIPSYPMIESVQPGSPAERAGMRYGDVLLLQDDRDLVANPPTNRYLAGDTTHFVVRRDGAKVPITVVLGRWDPPEEAEGVERTCRRVDTGPGRD